MKKCVNCGAVSEDRVNFCTSCGSSIFQPLPEAPAASEAAGEELLSNNGTGTAQTEGDPAPKTGEYTAPQNGGYTAPQTGGYTAPQGGFNAPQNGGYTAPQTGGYTAPQNGGGFNAPQSGEYSVPQTGGYTAAQNGYGYPAPGAEGRSPVSTPEPAPRVNILAGIVGALLFSLGGVVVFFILYQLNFIAGISGLVTFILANLGFGLFTKSRNTTASLITALIVTILMIPVAEYICLGYDVFSVYREEGAAITIFQALRMVPRFLEMSDVRAEVIKDVALSYLFSAIAVGAEFLSRKRRQR